MEKKLLFICESAESFLITALEKTLTGAGFSVTFIMPHPKEIEDVEDQNQFFLVYLDGDETRYNTTLEYLADLKKRVQEKHIFLIGNPIDIKGAYRFIPQDLTSGCFQRPVNTTDLITQLDLAFSGYRSDNTTHIERGFEGNEDVQKKTVLIVDDDTSFLRSMQTGLAKKFNVFIMNSGMNAVNFLKDRIVDLILLDYEMPVLSGLEVFRILRSEQNTETIPVIFLTSKDDKNTVMKVLEGKPADYLLKPISPTILTQTVENFFKKSESDQNDKKNSDPNVPAEMEMIDEKFSL
ncbi:MAG: response regulator [Treponema sp.]|nr:response regulator [Treponema sp.]